MSAPVDVLAVLDRIEAIADRRKWSYADLESIVMARAAAAEMIEHNRVMGEALEAIRDYKGNPRTPVHSSVSMSALARAALARVGGVS